MVKLAYRDLLRDRLSQITALLGIVLAIVLAVPFRRIAAPGVVPVGTNGFVDPSLLPGHEKHAILSAPDVVGMEELAVGFVPRCKPGGGRAVAVFAGSDARNDKSPPRDIIAGSITKLSSPDAVAVHATYFKELGILQRGDRAEVNNMQPTAQVVTNGICTLPHALATTGLARGLIDATPEPCDARRAAGAVAGHGSHRLRKIRQAQPLGAVRERSRCTADRRRGSGRDGWPRHCRTTALLEHWGAHRAACAWRLPGFHSPADPNAAAPSTAMGYAMGILLSLLAVYFLRDAKLLDAKLLIVMTTNSGLLLLALTVGVCVFAPISTIKMSRMMTCVDAAVVLVGRGRQGHGTNPGS